MTFLIVDKIALVTKFFITIGIFFKICDYFYQAVNPNSSNNFIENFQLSSA